MKKLIFFSDDLINLMVVESEYKTVNFTIDGNKVELDKWKVEKLIQLLVDFDKEVK